MALKLMGVTSIDFARRVLELESQQLQKLTRSRKILSSSEII